MIWEVEIHLEKWNYYMGTNIVVVVAVAVAVVRSTIILISR